MEYANISDNKDTLITSLNPYYNGRYSWRMISFIVRMLDYRLNPYYNGRYSWRKLCCLALQIR